MKSVVRRKLFFSTLLSVLGVLSIPGIPLGFVFNMLYIAIPSICIIAFDFYGLPFMWISYAKSKKMLRVYNAIVENNFLTVEEIYENTDVNIVEIHMFIKELISKNYLKGYKLQDGELVLNTNTKLQPKVYIEICPYCGGKGLKYIQETNKLKCPYCDAEIINKK